MDCHKTGSDITLTHRATDFVAMTDGRTDRHDLEVFILVAIIR